jgi:predicted ATP-grasp superfamily ATP-dependent carboligase
VGAVVLGGDFHGLGIIRSLGRRGIPICVIDDEYSIGRFSRYTTYAVTAPTFRQPKETVDFLLDTARRLNLKGWVLFPTRDEIVAAVARYRPQLADSYRVPTPEWESVKWAWNKWNTYRLAERLGIPIPRTWCPRSLDELDQIDAEFPLGVKPAVKEDFFYATKAKAWRADNRQQLRTLFERATRYVAGNEVLIQEIIPGDGNHQFSSCVFFKDGVAIASMEAKRRRQHPPEFGRAATFVETIECPELLSPTLRFLGAMSYYGLAEIEYKLDARDGRYKLLDVNARTWGFHCLGPFAGVDFSYLLYADQIGEPVQGCRGRPGVSWIRMVTDIPTGLSDMIAGRMDIKTYLRSLRGFSTESVFSSEDVMPTLAELALLPYLAVKRGY